jgi:hypothetical protein
VRPDVRATLVVVGPTLPVQAPATSPAPPQAVSLSAARRDIGTSGGIEHAPGVDGARNTRSGAVNTA